MDDGWPEGAECLDWDLGGVAEGLEVGGVHREDQIRALLDASLVVAEVRAVGGADLDQPGARLGDDVGHPEATANLHKLTTRDQDRTSGSRERSHRQQDGGGAVVDCERVLGAGELTDQAGEVLVAVGALPGLEVQL